MSDRKRAAEAESAGGDFESRGSLLTLVLAAIDEQGDIADELRIVAVFTSNLVGGLDLFNVGFKDGVENFVGRKRIGVLLVGAEFGGRGFFDC